MRRTFEKFLYFENNVLRVAGFVEKLWDLSGFAAASFTANDDDVVLCDRLHDDLLFGQDRQLEALLLKIEIIF